MTSTYEPGSRSEAIERTGREQIDVARAVPPLLNEATVGLGQPARVLRVRGTHRDDVGSIAGSVSRPSAVPVVAARDDDDESVLPGVLGRGGQRVELVGLQGVGAEGQVDHADVHAVVVSGAR